MSDELRFKLRDKDAAEDSRRRIAEQAGRALMADSQRFRDAARAVQAVVAAEIHMPDYSHIAAAAQAWVNNVGGFVAVVESLASQLDLMCERIAEAVRSMPEEERGEWIRAFEAAPLEEVDVNASDAGVM